MTDLLSSATRLVLPWVTFILGALTSFAVVVGIYRGTLDPKDVLGIFSSVVTFIIGFYFSKRESPVTPEGTVTTSKTNTEVTTVKDTPTTG